jgi:hypothetical protein
MFYIIIRCYKRCISRVFWTILLLYSISFVAWGQMISEKAQSADKFVNSIGITTHLRYLDTAYKNYNTIIKPKLQELGIRHIRDSVTPADSNAQKKFKELGKLGIKLTTVVDTRWNKTLKEVEEMVRMLPDSIEAIEGPNEWDAVKPTYRGQQFPEILRNFQNQLYATVKGTAITQHLPVLAASLAHYWNAKHVGSIACDFGNMHSYSGGKMPTEGYLDEEWIPSARKICLSKPIVSTETGWHNAIKDPNPPHPGVSEQASGKYIPRLYLEYFNRGIRRTFTYEFIDEHLKIDQESNFGLLHYDGTPKPAFTALKNLIMLLKDPGPKFPLKSLHYKLAANTPDIHHTLLQKRSGTFYLILWQEVPSFDLKTKEDLVVPARSISINLRTSTARAAIYQPLKSIKPLQQYKNPKRLNLTVSDQSLVIELTPRP